MKKEEIATVTILGYKVYYEEHGEADWIGVEEAIASGKTRGMLYRYRTVGEWWTEEDETEK